jgi:hypothetical protein
MARHSGPYFELISLVGSRNRIPHGRSVQHEVKVTNYWIKEYEVGFTSEVRGGSLSYPVAPGDKWEPIAAHLMPVSDRVGRTFEFSEAAGELAATAAARKGQMTQVRLTAWRRGLASVDPVEFPLGGPVAENVTIT